jgi:hypothetical protein
MLNISIQCSFVGHFAAVFGEFFFCEAIGTAATPGLIWRVTIDMREEVHNSLHVICPLEMSDFDNNCSKPSERQISLKSLEKCPSFYMRKGGRTISHGEAQRRIFFFFFLQKWEGVRPFSTCVPGSFT